MCCFISERDLLYYKRKYYYLLLDEKVVGMSQDVGMSHVITQG